MRDSPPKPSFRRKVSHLVGGPAGLKLSHAVMVGAAVVLGVALTVAVIVVPRLGGESPPDWDEPQTLPVAKPVWTDEIDSVDKVLVHDDVLVRMDNTSDEDNVVINELSTGEETLSTSAGIDSAWLSQDNLIVEEATGTSKVVVYDIHTGDEVRTIKLHDRSRVTVASGLLVALEADGETTSRLRATEAATGKEQWTTDLDRPWDESGINAPADGQDSVWFGSSDLQPQSTSSIVLVNDLNGEEAQGVWEQVDAIDVTTGERRWDSPIDYAGISDPDDRGYRLMESGDIYTSIADSAGEADPDAVTSYIIDSKTGEATEYAGPPEEVHTFASKSLQGDKLLTTDTGHPAIVDVTTGKTVWRAEGLEDGDALVNGGDVVFDDVTHENAGTTDFRNMVTDGMRAIDTGTGKTLWTKQGRFDAIDVVGDEMVTRAFAKSRGDEAPIQVFDWRAGKGKWQLDSGELLGHTADYLIFRHVLGGSDVKLSIVSR